MTAALCRFIADRLNAGWYPVVPGGVSGAAGEIVPLAHLFGTLVGDGFVHVDGRVVPAADALAGRAVPAVLAERDERAAPDPATSPGVAPYELGAKEGIALINGAPMAPALAVPLLLRARGAARPRHPLRRARRSPSPARHSRPYSPRVGELKGDPGQQAVHRRLWSTPGSHARRASTTRARRRSRCV